MRTLGVQKETELRVVYLARWRLKVAGNTGGANSGIGGGRRMLPEVDQRASW